MTFQNRRKWGVDPHFWVSISEVHRNLKARGCHYIAPLGLTLPRNNILPYVFNQVCSGDRTSLCPVLSFVLQKMGETQKYAVEATPDEDSDNERGTAPKVPDQFADESFKLFSKIQVTDPTPEEAKQIRNKCLWRILPFLCIGYHLMYVDKQTVSFPSTHKDID
jgi:hypothetical protein